MEHIFRMLSDAFHNCCFCPPGLDVCSPLCLRHLPCVLLTPPSLCTYLLSERGTSQVPAALDCSPKFSTKYFFRVASFFSSFQFPSLNPETMQSVSRWKQLLERRGWAVITTLAHCSIARSVSAWRKVCGEYSHVKAPLPETLIACPFFIPFSCHGGTIYVIPVWANIISVGTYLLCWKGEWRSGCLACTLTGAPGKMCSVKSGVPSIVNVDTLDNKFYWKEKSKWGG